MDSARSTILKRLHTALSTPTSMPYPQVKDGVDVFKPSTEEHLDILFAEKFQQLGGQFVFCESVAEAASNLQQLIRLKKWQYIFCQEPALQTPLQLNSNSELHQAEVGITSCQALLARTGSILLNSQDNKGRSISVFPPVHLVVAYSNQVLYTLQDALQPISFAGNSLASLYCITTGASRTADIEKTLVMGAHGPKEIFVFLIDETPTHF